MFKAHQCPQKQVSLPAGLGFEFITLSFALARCVIGATTSAIDGVFLSGRQEGPEPYKPIWARHEITKINNSGDK